MVNLHWFWLGVLAVLAVRFWSTNLQAREVASRFAEQACQLRRLQFLDGTVALQRFALERRPGARVPGLVRRYEFAFSDNGERRFTGTLVMRGVRVDRLELPPVPVELGAPPAPPAEQRPSAVVVPFRKPAP